MCKYKDILHDYFPLKLIVNIYYYIIIHISVYLFSIDILKFSKTCVLDTFNTVNLLYHIKEHYFQVYKLNLRNKSYLLSFTCLQINNFKIQYLCTAYSINKK